jgi:hypothetical protein
VGSAGSTFAGPISALGGVSVSGSGHVFACGIYGESIAISVGSSTFAACRDEP